MWMHHHSQPAHGRRQVMKLNTRGCLDGEGFTEKVHHLSDWYLGTITNSAADCRALVWSARLHGLVVKSILVPLLVVTASGIPSASRRGSRASGRD